MPEMNGRDLPRTLVCLGPHIRRLFMSGYTVNVIADHDTLDNGAHFSQKPSGTEPPPRNPRRRCRKLR